MFERVKRTAIRLLTYKSVVKELTTGTGSELAEKQRELVRSGILPPRQLRRAIIRKAPGEMDKAIKKFKDADKDITVAVLTEKLLNNNSFINLCNDIGLEPEYFRELAGERMKAKGIN